MSDALAKSFKSGPHAVLANLVGKWEGSARTWFEPGKLAETSPVKGRIKLVLGGTFAQHEYAGKLMGHRMKGLALLGYSLGEKQWQCAWINNVHNGTRIMLSLGKPGADAKTPDVQGSYPAGPETWGWRTTLTLKGRDRLILRHYNITPKGEESLGVEFDYRRV